MLLLLFLAMMMPVHAQTEANIIAVVSVPKAGTEGPIQSWERGLEILPGAHLAIKHINDSNILGKYILNLTEIVIEGCDVNAALVEFIGHVTQPERNILGIVGPNCNEAARAIASLSLTEYEQFHLVQVSSASAPLFEDAHRYPYLYHMLPSSNIYSETVFGLTNQLKWSKIAVLCGSNEDDYYCRAADSFVLSVSDEDHNIELVFYGEVASEEPSILATLRYLHDSGARIILAFLPTVQASHLVYAAYNNGMKWPDYAWILPGQNVEDVTINSTVTEGLLFLQPQLKAGDDFQIITNITYSEYYDELLATSLQSNPYANVFYDSVWALALAFSETINATHAPDQNMVIETISEEFSRLSFPGTLGSIEFRGSSSRTNATIDIFHIRNREAQCVGHYNQVSGTVINISLLNDIPSDELERHYQLLTPTLTGIVSSAIAFCLLFITAMLFLFWYYRNEPEIKATSTRLSLLMFLGCYLLCISALVDTVFDGLKTPLSAGAAVCCVITWTSTIGLDLILATLMAKLLRVYRVFTLFGKTGKFYSDSGLVVMILILVSGGVIILIVWAAVDIHHTEDVETFNAKTTPPHYDVEQICYSKYDVIWVGSAVMYHVVLLIPLLLLAFKTRTVWRRNFKDTKKVTALVFTLALLMGFGLPLWRILEEETLKHLTVISLYVAIPVFSQFFLFVPKTVPPLVRDVKSKVWKKV